VKIARIIFFVALLSAISCNKASTQPGAVAPDFRLNDLTGQTRFLNAELARPVVLTFFATWCAPCREEIPHLIDIHNRFPDRASVLCVDVDPENIDKIQSIARSFAIPYPILLDEGKKVMAAYGVQELPVTILITPDGRVASIFSTIGEREKKTLIEMVERIISKP
jgi:peroxiredoxin